MAKLNLSSKVQWVGPTLGQVFGTIGDDSKFKVWREDPSQAPKGGRRFRCIFSQSPSNHVSYVSLDIKTVKVEVWVALITHDGLLSLIDPSEAESMTSWKEVDTIYPFGQHSRGTEPRSKVSFHQAERPCYDAVIAGLDPRALSIAVSAMNIIKIYRALKTEDTNYQLYEMLEMKANTPLINDVAWAPGCIRPYDLIATACDDGSVRIFELTTPHGNKVFSAAGGGNSGKDRAKASSSAPKNTPSGIGVGLAGANRAAARQTGGSTRITHEWRELANLSHGESAPVWKVRWTHDGDIALPWKNICKLIITGNALASTGDSGNVHLWKPNLQGEFIEFAETGPS